MKNTLVIILFAFIVTNAVAQSHIKNQHYLQLNVGAYDDYKPDFNNFSIQIEHGKYNKKLNSHGFALMYAKKYSSNLIPIEKFQASFKQEINIFSSADLISTFKILGTINFGYESINRDQKYYNDDYIGTKSSFILALGTGAEYELTPFVIGTRVTYNFLSTYQKFSTYPYIGLKFHLP